MIQPYNGHRSYTCWNVSLWISNDEHLYVLARRALVKARDDIKNSKSEFGRNQCVYKKASGYLMHTLEGCRTPDGVKYTRLAIREALREWTLDDVDNLTVD